MKLQSKFSFTALLGLLPIVAFAAKNTEKPNVIYILVDDLGIGDLGCYGQKIVKTPNIDRLASEGLKFNNHYSGSTVSAPSRCSLITGKHTGHSYIRGNRGVTIDNEKYDTPLIESEVTVADLFKKADYTTACIGKWGLGGPNSIGDPKEKGFDYFYGYLGQANAHSYFPRFLYEINNKETKKVDLNKEFYSHELIVDKALEFINEHSEDPFFMYFTPTIPHAELKVPENDKLFKEYYEKLKDADTIPYHDKYSGYGPQKYPLSAFAAMVTRLDNDVKKVVDLLEEKGILNNTIILFSSDNGTHLEGGHRPDFFNSSGGYRGTKRDLYDGGVRTPFIIYWKDIIKKGRETGHVSAFWDFMPTVCELIGVEKPSNCDGVSFLPTITKKGKQKSHDYLYWEFHERGGKRAVLKDGWKLIELNAKNDKNESVFELYNTKKNPLEREEDNEFATNKAKVAELMPLLKSARSNNEFWNF